MKPENDGNQMPSLGKRDLLVDVQDCQANIVEGLDSGSRFRRLKEQQLTEAERLYAQRLKRQIVYGENGGAYSLSGLYQPRAEDSARELAELVAELERYVGAEAWDRRRFPR
jgi:hypothetical protein